MHQGPAAAGRKDPSYLKYIFLRFIGPVKKQKYVKFRGGSVNRLFGLQILTLKISDDVSNLVAGSFPIKVMMSKSVGTAHASINQIVPRIKREPDNFETDVSSV